MSKHIGKSSIPRSKYDKTLPYTYEARVPILEGDDVFNSYFADTICGLIEYLNEKNIQPNDATIFEIYQEQEFPIDARLYTNSENTWLFKPDICCSFQKHYKGHIQEGKCTFRDRDGHGRLAAVFRCGAEHRDRPSRFVLSSGGSRAGCGALW